MKKLKMFAVLALLVSVLVGCTTNQPNDGGKDEGPKNYVVISDYKIDDPEGVSYEKRMPMLLLTVEGDGMYEQGVVESYAVFYSKENKGVAMVNVYKFKDEAAANAFGANDSGMQIEGVYALDTVDETFFKGMEAFMPTIDSWVDQYHLIGYVDFE